MNRMASLVPTGLGRMRIVTSSWVFHLFLSGIIMLLVFLHPPMLFKGDFDTALNYLNTIVSSLSTILALCISIILVAIQLTASNYTHRVLDYFVRLPYNASLFSFYLVTILRSFFLMSYVRDDPALDPKSTPVPATLFGLSPIPSSLDLAMSADLVMVAICFFSLLLYMYAVIQLLKPERIISLIVLDYDRAIIRKRWRAALDNVEQICDIAKRAATFSDSVTGARCVEVMSQVALQLPLPRNGDEGLLQIHQSVVDQWVEMVAVAIKERETGLLRSVIEALFKQATQYMDGEAWEGAEMVVNAYRHLVFAHLLNDGQVFYVNRVATKLYELADVARSHGQRGETFCLATWQMVSYMGECSFASLPGGIVSLMEGLLMAKEIPRTLEALSQKESHAALITYFRLWKAFSRRAHTSDIARWARWWSESAEGDLQGKGQAIALGLARHEGKSDFAKTLQFAWKHTSMRPLLSKVSAEAGDSVEWLFDGWPLLDDEPADQPAVQRHPEYPIH